MRARGELLLTGAALVAVVATGVTRVSHGDMRPGLMSIVEAAADDHRNDEVEPVLSAVEPKTVKADSTPQTIGVVGTNFSPGMTARLVGPLGDVWTFGANSLRSLTRTSFKIDTPFDDAGSYQLSVRTASGTRSKPLTIAVRKLP